MVEGIDFVRDGEVAVLTFARPEKKNAITHDMWSSIPDVVAAVDQDPDVKVLLLTGSGQDFSAGADIGEFREQRCPGRPAEKYDQTVENAVQALLSMRKPSVSMIRGYCVGGGCQLAVATDMRFCDHTARFGITPAKLGIVYDFLSTRELIALVGPAHARFLLLSGELIEADRAREIGLVNDVCHPTNLEATTRELLATLCTRSQISVRGMNRIIEKIVSGQQESDSEVNDIQREAAHSADYAEGVNAFLERRKPEFG